MLKSYLALILLVCLKTAPLFGQNYILNYWIEPYEPLKDAISVPLDEFEAGWNKPLDLDFTFTVSGESFPNEQIRGGSLFFLDASGFYAVTAAAGWSWIARPDSKISYTLDGEPGTQILKIEFQNMGFSQEYEKLGTREDYMNSQMWLYEGINKVQFHFGENNTSVHAANAFKLTGLVGVSKLLPQVWIRHLLKGDDANPVLVINTGFSFPGFSGVPSPGRVFEICPDNGVCLVNTTDDLLTQAKLYPNPSTGQFRLDLPGIPGTLRLTLLDVIGRKLSIYEEYTPGQIIDIPVSEGGFIKVLAEYEGHYKSFSLMKLAGNQ